MTAAYLVWNNNDDDDDEDDDEASPVVAILNVDGLMFIFRSGEWKLIIKRFLFLYSVTPGVGRVA